MSRNPQFASAVSDDDIEVAEPVTRVNADPNMVSVRIKGTWRMYWGTRYWDFEEGTRYTIPRDLMLYLKSHGNVYDTMA